MAKKRFQIADPIVLSMDIMIPGRKEGHEKVWVPEGTHGYVEWSDGTDTVLCVFPAYAGWRKSDPTEPRWLDTACLKTTETPVL